MSIRSDARSSSISFYFSASCQAKRADSVDKSETGSFEQGACRELDRPCQSKRNSDTLALLSQFTQCPASSSIHLPEPLILFFLGGVLHYSLYPDG